MIKKYWRKGSKQKRNILLLVFFSLLLILFFRDDIQPVFLFIRKYIFIILLVLIGLFLEIRNIRKTISIGKKVVFFVFLMILFGVSYFVGWHLNMYSYMKTFNVFNNLNRIEISELPLTKNERVQPLRNIFSMAKESVGETKDVSLPHLVRVDSLNKWTMAVQPAAKYTWQGVTGNTEEVFSVSSTTSSPRFSSENRVPVTFSIGESLRFSRNTYNAVVQRFNPFQLFTTEPSDTFYMKNDEGEWVQVVSLIKWKGFFFPYPTFGGVMVIDNGEHNFNDYIERLLIGKGEYISANDLEKYPYLNKQNILSEKVSRLQAESLKFLGGFTDPLPWNMETAVKIPILEDEQNEQPYVADFDFSDTKLNAFNGLYHWFGLEPVGKERRSLTYSVFIPADGTDKFYFYDHASKKQGYAGVSAMPLKVIESQKEFDWSVNKPVEFRPYIKNIAGRKRLFFLGTVSSVRKGSNSLDGSATPDLALVDSEYRNVVWVNAKHPSKWDVQVYNELGETWKESESSNLFFKVGNNNFEKKIIDEPNIGKDSIEILTKQIQNLEEIKKLQIKIDSLKRS